MQISTSGFNFTIVHLKFYIYKFIWSDYQVWVASWLLPWSLNRPPLYLEIKRYFERIPFSQTLTQGGAHGDQKPPKAINNQKSKNDIS